MTPGEASGLRSIVKSSAKLWSQRQKSGADAAVCCLMVLFDKLYVYTRLLCKQQTDTEFKTVQCAREQLYNQLQIFFLHIRTHTQSTHILPATQSHTHTQTHLV